MTPEPAASEPVVESSQPAPPDHPGRLEETQRQSEPAAGPARRRGRPVSRIVSLYRREAELRINGYVRRDPLALLELPPGQTDPYRYYEELRRRGRLSPTGWGGWVSTSHPVCTQLLRDRRFGVGSPFSPPEEDEEVGLSLLSLNPPDHTRLRRLVAPAFSPPRIRAYQPTVDRVVRQMLEGLAERGEGDLITDFALPLPIAVITALLGVPDANAPDLARYGAAIGAALDGIHSVGQARQAMAARTALRVLFRRLFDERRREPGDDVISQLVTAEGEQVRPQEMVPLCTLLLVAGFETTVNLIGNGALALLAHPDQWQRLRADPSLAPSAVEEVLRYDSPVQRTSRVALEAVELDGRLVGQGQWIEVLLGAANRDPEVYEAPDRFDIGRGAGDHLAFSSGVHHCLGQALARLEGAAAFKALAELAPELRRRGPVRRRRTTTLRGLASLPVRLR